MRVYPSGESAVASDEKSRDRPCVSRRGRGAFKCWSRSHVLGELSPEHSL